ncbi:unnamed protein product [Euphydryas editha]|uniref:Ionotropic receptor 21a n=1 Tax=Euphydryas editha TaxID=104508 RepID=A0AAU9UT72_EUPED|nr:unnamed protein product [Euphydryas editha]
MSKNYQRQSFSYGYHNVLKSKKYYSIKEKSKIIQRETNKNLKNKLKSASLKRRADLVFHGHPKTREEIWHENFLSKNVGFDQTPSLTKLINNITLTYLNDCTPVILYDEQIKSRESYLFQDLFKNFPVSYMHGYIGENDYLEEPKLLRPKRNCYHFIVFLNDVMRSTNVLGRQSESKVVVIARSSQWAVQEFLAGPTSKFLVNLLVIGQSFKDDVNMEAAFILYTHILYTDGLGASKPLILCSWSHGKFSRKVNLFPTKKNTGYAGHRFIVAAAHQPPFVFRRIQTDWDGGNPKVVWDGLEIKLLNLLAERNNFSIEIVEPRELHLSSGDAVAKEVTSGRADIGIAGMYVTNERARDMDMSFAHSHDCAVFITLTSTALPRYRAILGPFHWHVWVALTFTYLIAIFPLAFSDKHTLRHLIQDKGEVENMFWYVFGTFTNCFTFVGKNSWSKTTKITTRILIGWYWLFTIIITSCYTGSIIAFVTLPIFPETVDTIAQLLAGFYRVGTLDHGGWERWFSNSSDPQTNKLLKKLEFVPDIKTGIQNITKAFFWPYAFLGSKSELEYIAQANFSKTESKRSLLHISNKCFVPFGISLSFPNNSLYGVKLSEDISRMVQSGIIDKFLDEVRWEIQRSKSGRLLSVVSSSLKINSIEEKGLTLEDTQGMFLLLGAGFLIAATALVSELMGGFSKRCRSLGRKITSTRHSKELIDTPITSMEKMIKNNSFENRLQFDDRTSSFESEYTCDGQIITVTQDSIVIHNDSNIHSWKSRRSSLLDSDYEIEEIFENNTHAEGQLDQEKRNNSASKGTFGDSVVK